MNFALRTLATMGFVLGLAQVSAAENVMMSPTLDDSKIMSETYAVPEFEVSSDTDLGLMLMNSEQVEPVKGKTVRFKASDLKSGFYKDFEIVIRINKARSGRTKQTMTVYKNGERVLHTLVSTGSDKKKEKGWIFGPDRDTYTNTPTGYFKPRRLSREHYSDLWDTKMPWSIFFSGGVAIHQAGSKWGFSSESKLGKAVSGGCVRLSSKAAPVVYKYVSDSGRGMTPKVSRSGYASRNEQGEYVMEESWRTLIIVENVRD